MITFSTNISGHLHKWVECVPVIQRSWGSCLFKFTLKFFCCSVSTSCANLTNWWCSYPRVSLFLTNPRPRPKLVCTRARQLLSFKRKIRSSSIPGFSLQQSVGCVEVAPVPGRLSPGHNLFSTPRFLYNWHRLCSNAFDTEAPVVPCCIQFEVFSFFSVC